MISILAPLYILKVFRDIFCLLLFLFSFAPGPILTPDGLMNLVSGSLMTRHAASPRPFFIQSDWVDDFFAGDIYQAFQEAQVS